jgi:phytoene dehydrogenase-like protein
MVRNNPSGYERHSINYNGCSSLATRNEIMAVLVIGAGLAGLTCARALQRAGREVTVLEAEDGVGGRVRSDRMGGYTLDRGFQVLFDAYPAVRRQLDLTSLQLHAFDPGALVALDGGMSVITDPLRDADKAAALRAALTPLVSPLDKLRTLRLALELRDTPDESLDEEPDVATIDFLRARGFGRRIVDRFFRPFYGGIFLSRTLGTSARSFKFYFKMLSLGSACLPAQGMGAISDQLAAPLLRDGRIRLNTRVEALRHEGERVVGVRLAGGDELPAEAVVLATSAPVAAQLSGLSMPEGALEATVVYFGGSAPVYRGKKIVLNASPDALVNNAQLLSNVAPSYAPPERHLLSAAVLGAPPLSDEELFARTLADLRRMFAGSGRALRALNGYAPLMAYRINYAQFPQPPGVRATLPDNRTDRPGLYLAGEFTDSSSINGAIASGERCAAAILG